MTFEERILQLPVPGARPVDWFVDIDGVLNVIGRRPRANAWSNYKNAVALDDSDRPWPVLYAPELVRLMNLLHDRQIVRFQWLTTWEHMGPRSFAPAVGLDIGDRVAAFDAGTESTWWKLDHIVEHLAGTADLFIWTDDDIKHFDLARDVVSMMQPERALILCPEESRGLTPGEFDQILTAIEELVWE